MHLDVFLEGRSVLQYIWYVKSPWYTKRNCRSFENTMQSPMVYAKQWEAAKPFSGGGAKRGESWNVSLLQQGYVILIEELFVHFTIWERCSSPWLLECCVNFPIGTVRFWLLAIKPAASDLCYRIFVTQMWKKTPQYPQRLIIVCTIRKDSSLGFWGQKQKFRQTDL